MLIMVIQGSEGRVRDSVLTQLAHLKQPKVVTIDVGFVASPDERVARLKLLLHRSRQVLNVVIGANSKEEIAFLRAKHALFCNLHRHFPNHLLNVEGAINRADVLISPNFVSDDDVIVLRPDEAFSECVLRSKFRRHVA